MPDVLGVYDTTTVVEYLQFFAGAYRIPRKQWPALIDGLLELVDLAAKRDAQVNDLSRGMKQRLSLARALVHDPDLLILDEPASGLDPRARIDLRTLLLTLREMGKTVLISSHILPELQEVCTDVAIIEAGRLLAAGPPAQILDRLGGGRSVVVRLPRRRGAPLHRGRRGRAGPPAPRPAGRRPRRGRDPPRRRRPRGPLPGHHQGTVQ